MNEIATIMNEPLNREELSAFYTALHYENKEMFEKCAAGIVKQQEQINSLAYMTRESNAALMSAVNKIELLLSSLTTAKLEAKVNPLFHSSLSSAQQLLWIDSIKGKIADICLDSSARNIGPVYKWVYAKMREENYDLGALLKEYRSQFNNPDATTLTMIASSGELRQCFLNCLNKYYYRKEQRKGTGRNSRTVMICPDKVTAIVKRMTGGKKPYGRNYHKAFELAGIDKQTTIENAKKKYGLSRCSLGYAISKDPALMRKLNSAVNKYLEGK